MKYLGCMMAVFIMAHTSEAATDVTYVMMKGGYQCTNSAMITDVDTCKKASKALGLQFGGTVSTETYFPVGCLWYSVYGYTYLNQASTSTPRADAGGICTSAPTQAQAPTQAPVVNEVPSQATATKPKPGASCPDTSASSQLKDEEWNLWKQTHSKTYTDTGEEYMRYHIWSKNKADIDAHNKLGLSYTLGMNHIGDLTEHEIKVRNGLLPDENSPRRNRRRRHLFVAPTNVNIPDTVDWRDKGYVTAVKEQGQCGSCWSFSSTGALEGQMFKKTGKLVSLSEQNLLDCANGNRGCHGGRMPNAFDYVKDHGIDTDKNYPYTAIAGTCSMKGKVLLRSAHGYVSIPKGDEEALKEAVATIGPISVGIDANKPFGQYKSGVYDNPNCTLTNEHAVLVVGYGTQHGKDYWLVKNSWGEHFGQKGYIKMSRNKNNQCGIAQNAVYPLV